VYYSGTKNGTVDHVAAPNMEYPIPNKIKGKVLFFKYNKIT